MTIENFSEHPVNAIVVRSRAQQIFDKRTADGIAGDPETDWRQAIKELYPDGVDFKPKPVAVITCFNAQTEAKSANSEVF